MPKTSVRIRAGGEALRAALDTLSQPHDFPLLIGESANAVLITDPLDRIIYINPGLTRMLGHAPGDILGRQVSLLFDNREPTVVQRAHACFERREAFISEEIVFGRSGQRFWVSLTANPVYSGDERLVTVCVITDITDTKLREVLQNRAVDAMARDVSSAEVLELICREVENIIPEAVVAVHGIDEHQRLYSVAAPSLPDSCRRAIRGDSPRDRHSPSWRAAVDGESVAVADLSADPDMRARLRDFIDFGIRACWATPVLAPDGRRLGTVTYYYFDSRHPDDFQKSLSRVLVNLCALALERRRIRDDMRQISFYDPLTGLPNRGLLLANCEKMLQEFRQRDRDVPTAVFSLNIDRFRRINSSLGFDAGNELLRIVAGRLSDKRYPGDSVGRVGADEFVLVCPGCDEGKASLVANRLLAVVSEPCRVGDVEITPSASVGIALYPDNAFSMEALIDFASLALALAKNEGEGRCKFYSEEANARARRRLSLEARLRQAAVNNEFRLFYQPQVSFVSGQLHGVEALARWENREFGSVPPESFIPMAESAGIIDGISEWVISEVCRQMGDWRRRGVAVPSVAVNLSAPNFHNADLPRLLGDQLQRNGLKVSDLVLELTESIFLDGSAETMAALGRIRDMGFRLSLDDFGTGYSGLGYLRNIPITEIKLDRSFVRDLVSNPASQTLSQAIMRLGENLGLRVVVEGVETAEQFTLLKTQGFHILQGYYVSRPLSPAALEEWLADTGGRDKERRGDITNSGYLPDSTTHYRLCVMESNTVGYN